MITYGVSNPVYIGLSPCERQCLSNYTNTDKEVIQINPTLNELLDKANLVDYTGVVIKVKDEELTKELEDIPKHSLSYCVRLQTILENFIKTEIPLIMVYDLWRIHSLESFCSGFTNIEGVSDDVLLSNMLVVLRAISAA